MEQLVFQVERRDRPGAPAASSSKSLARNVLDTVGGWRRSALVTIGRRAPVHQDRDSLHLALIGMRPTIDSPSRSDPVRPLAGTGLVG
jgi:hypothetical protein